MKIVFLYLEHAKSETDTQIGSPIYLSCECECMNVSDSVYMLVWKMWPDCIAGAFLEQWCQLPARKQLICQISNQWEVGVEMGFFFC